MKIKYSMNDRLMVRDTMRCIDCGGWLHHKEVEIGHIFCVDCFFKIRLNIPKGLCIECAFCGVKTFCDFKTLDLGLGMCKEHRKSLNDLLCELKEIRPQLRREIHNG